MSSQSLRQTPLQWKIIALAKALNVVAIEALITDLHPGAKRAHGWKLLDGKPDRLRCGRKATIAQRLSRPALPLAHEQLGWYAVVECHNLAVCRHIDVPTRLVSVCVSARPKRLSGFASRPEAERGLEHVFAAVLGLNESIALCQVEPFDSACSHHGLL